MVRSRSACAAIGCLILLAAVTPVRVHQSTVRANQSRGITVRVERFDELQAWFRRVHQHEPWQYDSAAAEVAKLSPLDLQEIFAQLDVLRQLIDLAATRGIEEIRVGNRPLKTRQLPALLGVTDDELDLPYNARDLAKADNPARVAISRLMVRAAILHTVIGLSPAEIRDLPPGTGPRPGDPRPRPGLRPGEMHTSVRIQDGRQVAVVNFSKHWEIARAALDLVGPPPSGSDAVRLWYHATAVDMQVRRDYATLRPHLANARKILTADFTTFLLSGAAYENLAAPPVQSAIAESGLGYLTIGSPAELLTQAEQHLRRALELDPESALVRLRLGRVLQLLARHAEAADVLRQAEPRLPNSVWRYFAALYLGRAEHATGRDDEARAAYRRAIALYPKAQSPRLGLAEIGWLAADQAVAVSELRGLFATVTGAGGHEEPWWRYDISHVVDTPSIWDEMRIATTRAAR